jgi:hypothetical protein
MENEFITIAKFNRLMDAYLVASRIEYEGIECFLPDEMLAKSARNHLLGASQIRLQVKEADVAEALRILNKNPSEISPNDMKI